MVRCYAILAAAILAVTPLQGVLGFACGCIVSDPCGSGTDSSTIADNDSCCPVPSETAPGPSRDAPFESPCSGDDCPRPCCGIAKVPVLLGGSGAPRIPGIPANATLTDPGCGSAQAHLDRMPKPPRHA
ncbi:MAG: hypothetical protein ACF8Q5_11105 [Phycisphaerales bacterium JB040]